MVLTMNTLPIPLYFLVEHCIFVLGQHFLLSRHIFLPRFHLLQGLAQACESCVDGRDDVIGGPETAAVTVLLVAGEAPWDFPAS